jgi:hypothetical protein
VPVGVDVVEALRRVVRYVVDWRIEGRVRDRDVVREARSGIVARRRWLGAMLELELVSCVGWWNWKYRVVRRCRKNGLDGNWTPGGCELEVFAVEISRISRGSMFALFAPWYKFHRDEF